MSSRISKKEVNKFKERQLDMGIEDDLYNIKIVVDELEKKISDIEAILLNIMDVMGIKREWDREKRKYIYKLLKKTYENKI